MLLEKHTTCKRAEQMKQPNQMLYSVIFLICMTATVNSLQRPLTFIDCQFLLRDTHFVYVCVAVLFNQFNDLLQTITSTFNKTFRKFPFQQKFDSVNPAEHILFV